jgi:hypothetical protein
LTVDFKARQIFAIPAEAKGGSPPINPRQAFTINFWAFLVKKAGRTDVRPAFNWVIKDTGG